MASDTNPFIKALFDFPSKKFIEHLEFPDNTRILFSGKFGIGKTIFLKHFFQEDTQNEVFKKGKYNSYHIYPVNYSIASNEDIFRYIKYDVITSMVLKDIKIEEKDFSYLNTLPDFAKKNLLKIFANLIYMVPKIGKDVFESFQKLNELKEAFYQYHKEVTKAEGDLLIGFLEQIEMEEGSIYKGDVITKLISSVLIRQREETKKDNVLIIDDLDRIDPEHIFRILNVFAAHLDAPAGLPNKLGFDKVIIVCDINNIKYIFRAKYGQQTDFSGYIDKFFSNEVFYFDNREILQSIAREAFFNVEI
ncbi:MAG: NTPase KAP, partial [Flavisolibacter sp.]|nr:NTPase KAP [Flavisolibacter sp.]